MAPLKRRGLFVLMNGTAQAAAAVTEAAAKKVRRDTPVDFLRLEESAFI